MKQNLQEVFVSVILLAEDTGTQHTQAAIENVLTQTHENIEIIVSTLFDADELKKKHEDNWRVKFLDSDPQSDFFNECKKIASGDVIFYKTVTNVLWFPRHIEAHLEELRKNKRAKWALSHIEYRDVDNPDHPLNTIGFRIENPPETEKVILDELVHYPDVECDFSKCIISEGDEQIFYAGLILKQWYDKNYSGLIPKEITVVQWVKFGEEDGITEEQAAKQLGIPATTEIKEENKFVDGNIEIIRSIPTIMGNSHLNEYNDQMREVVKNTEDITSIGLKRTIGMGDVILCEPIIKKLKQKYPKAKLTFYTAKSDIVKFFKHQPDQIFPIEPNSLLQDFLSTTQNQIKFDLDLAYESRLKVPFIDAFAQSCGITFDDYKDKHVQFIDVKSSLKFDKPYVVVVGDGSGWIGKTWGKEKYTDIIKYVQGKGYDVVEPGFSDFSELTDKQFHGCNLDMLVELLANCEFYIGTDNGPMHIAKSLNIPSIIIAGAALPYYSNPNREDIYYVQDNGLDCLGCKHSQFFSMQGEQISFVPTCVQEEQGVCLKSIQASDVQTVIDKFLAKPKSLFKPRTNTKFYFNIPGYSYYYDESIDLIQRGNIDYHPDQHKDISEEYAPRWEQLYNEYSVPFVEEVMNHIIDPTKENFLDVGCNIGLVVKAALEKGFNAYGIDINGPSVSKAHELFPELKFKVVNPDYMKKDLDTSPDRPKYPEIWDIIVMNQTLEHISDPIMFLNAWKNKLRDEDGLMFIGIPSMDEEGAREKMHQFQTIGTGEHIWLPTNKSFDFLMKKVGMKYEHLQDTKKGIFVKAWKK